MERILFIWSKQNPSGYFQGLGDIICQFILVFLSEYISKY